MPNAPPNFPASTFPNSRRNKKPSRCTNSTPNPAPAGAATRSRSAASTIAIAKSAKPPSPKSSPPSPLLPTPHRHQPRLPNRARPLLLPPPENPMSRASFDARHDLSSRAERPVFSCVRVVNAGRAVEGSLFIRSAGSLALSPDTLPSLHASSRENTFCTRSRPFAHWNSFSTGCAALRNSVRLALHASVRAAQPHRRADSSASFRRSARLRHEPLRGLESGPQRIPLYRTGDFVRVPGGHGARQASASPRQYFFPDHRRHGDLRRQRHRRHWPDRPSQ